MLKILNGTLLPYCICESPEINDNLMCERSGVLTLGSYCF
jgi:hypothetical protein